MNFLFHVSKLYIPEYKKKRELMNLFQITASAFERTIPETRGLSFDECLVAFARFTKSEVDEAIRTGEDLLTIQDLLYQGAYEFGHKFRKQFRVSTARDVMEASRFLYTILGIDFKGTEKGSITISKCFFSQHYSTSTCCVISSLDAGMIAGLSGGGRLTFSERITEGSTSCNAHFIFKEQFQ
jgi:predicted hydrocarbon binding protein